jgi:hypothetical protein
LAIISSGEPYLSRKGHTVPHCVQEEQESMKSVTVADMVEVIAIGGGLGKRDR